MTTQTLSREVALRVGLAAKIMAQVSARDLLLVLIESLGNPLTEEKLKKITVTDLRAALQSVDGEEDSEDTAISKEAMKLAVRYLWGEEFDAPKLPTIEAYSEGDMPGSVRVAIASATGEEVDGHFGSCPRYLIYQLSIDEARLIDIRTTEAADDAEDKNAYRANLVKDCQVIFIQSVGGPAAAKIVRAGIYPMKKPDGGPATMILQEFQDVMKSSPPPWLAKAMGIQANTELKYAEGAG
jgi:nitrogen fixation protein NifX